MGAMVNLPARLSWFKAALDRPIPKILLYVWLGISIWDTVTTQLLSPKLSDDAPTFFVVLSIMSGWFPWTGWAFIGMALLTFITLEYGYRSSPQIIGRQTEPEIEPPEASPKSMLDVVELELTVTRSASDQSVVSL